MKLVFRYDDFGSSKTVPLAADEAVIGAFVSRGLPLIIAVTPFMVDDVHSAAPQPSFPIEDDRERLTLLGRALVQGSQIALHGYSHARSRERDSTEFAGQPRSIQREKIAQGKRALNRCLPGVPVEIFVPPWNAHDEKTIVCLAEQGLRVLCGGPDASCKKYNPVQFVPSLLETWDFLEYLRRYSLNSLSRLMGDAVLVITVHAYDFFDKTRPGYSSLNQFERTLDELKSRDIPVIALPLDRPLPPANRWRETRLKSKAYLLRSGTAFFAHHVFRFLASNGGMKHSRVREWLVEAAGLCLYMRERIRRRLRVYPAARALWSLLISKPKTGFSLGSDDKQLRGIYVVSEAGCMNTTTGAWRHISIGIEELSKHFDFKPLLPGIPRLPEEGRLVTSRPLARFRNSKLFGAMRDMKTFAANWRIALKQFKEIRSDKPHFCYCRAAFLDPLPLMLKLSQTCRVFIEANGFQFEVRAACFRSALAPFHKVFERWTYGKADYVFFVGTHGDYWRLPKRNWSNVENGVEREFLESFKDHSKQTGQTINLCIIARFMHHHQPELLVKAVKLLAPDERRRLRLHLFGTGFELLKTALSGVIEIIDHGFTDRSKLAIQLRAMDAGVITAVPEYASHMKLFDYGAAKLVAIVPATHNLRNWFKDGEVIFFKPSDAQMLSQQITALIMDGDKIGRGEALHKRIRNEFLWEAVFERKAAIIEHTCAGEDIENNHSQHVFNVH